MKLLKTAAAIAACVVVPPMLAWAADPTYRANAFAGSGDVSCYSWTGGDKSAGGFTKCRGEDGAAALPPPVQPSPIMMPLSATPVCPPPVVAEPKKATKKPVKRRPLPTCKPA